MRLYEYYSSSKTRTGLGTLCSSTAGKENRHRRGSPEKSYDWTPQNNATDRHFSMSNNATAINTWTKVFSAGVSQIKVLYPSMTCYCHGKSEIHRQWSEKAFNRTKLCQILPWVVVFCRHTVISTTWFDKKLIVVRIPRKIYQTSNFFNIVSDRLVAIICLIAISFPCNLIGVTKTSLPVSDMTNCRMNSLHAECKKQEASNVDDNHCD